MELRHSLPRELVTHVTAICGEKGEEWFRQLPDVVAKLENAWSLKVGSPFEGIEYNFVARAKRSSGEDVVVKISPPFESIEIYGEAKYLRSRNRNGAVELLAEDRELRAILLERVIPGEALFERFKSDPESSVAPAIDVLQTVLQPPPFDMNDVATLDGWFNNFRRWRESEFPAGYAEKAFSIYERLSGQANHIYYLHGDFHPGNIVTATRSPFLAIDPKGIVGHVGYEISVFLNNLHWWQKADPNVARLLDIAVIQFSTSFDIPENELREWAFAGMVIGAWWNFDDMPELYDNEVAKADIWDV